MAKALPTIIIRHRRENLKKCTLTGLEEKQNMRFYTYPMSLPPPLHNYLLLSLDGPPLTKEDQSFGICLIDGTWKYATIMERYFQMHYPSLIKRSLPEACKTAYPRKQTHCPLPSQGLASIEALFFADLILQKDPFELLQDYYWKDAFLHLNASLISDLQGKRSQ